MKREPTQIKCVAVIPYFLNNSETWTELNNCAIEKLEGLQNQFLIVLLAPHNPFSLLGDWDAYNEKQNIKEETAFQSPSLQLAFQIAVVQSKLGYPGLVTECEVIRKELGLP